MEAFDRGAKLEEGNCPPRMGEGEVNMLKVNKENQLNELDKYCGVCFLDKII